jgi:hypothetical protein
MLHEACRRFFQTGPRLDVVVHSRPGLIFPATRKHEATAAADQRHIQAIPLFILKVFVFVAGSLGRPER